MKILFNTYPVAFDCPGGGEIQLLKTKDAIEALGHKIVLFDTWAPQFADVDIVHYFSVQGGSMNFCAHVKRLGLPLVISPILWLGKDKDMYPLGEISELFKICDMIFPNSYAEKKLFQEHFNIDNDKFYVAHNAVEKDNFYKTPQCKFRDKFNIEDEFILCVANIEQRKNQLGLIKAMKRIGMPLILIGNIRDIGYYQQCLREGYKELRYIGPLDHHDILLAAAYHECRLFALPSLLETPSLSALEAAVSGAKIVITEVGCTKEYFGDEVTYVDPYSVDSIYEGIIHELDNERPDSLGGRIVNMFSWENTARESVDGYLKAINNCKSKNMLVNG
jgi:glycosyltransferase involved in cell wall biosynthesis